MRNKPNSTSVIAGMTQAQRDTLEVWLCDKNLSYTETMAKCKREFGLVLHPTAVRKFYHQTSQKRVLDRIINSAAQANSVVKVFTENPSDSFRAVVGVLGQWAFETSVDPKKAPDMFKLRQLLELLVDLRKDEREAGKFALEREKWELDVAKLCFDHHAELQKITADNSMDEDARLLAIRRRLFGANVPI